MARFSATCLAAAMISGVVAAHYVHRKLEFEVGGDGGTNLLRGGLREVNVDGDMYDNDYDYDYDTLGTASDDYDYLGASYDEYSYDDYSLGADATPTSAPTGGASRAAVTGAPKASGANKTGGAQAGGGGAAKADTNPGAASSGSISVFSWNSHYQCNQNDACRKKAIAKFGELVKECGAQIATGIELKGASSALSGWATSGEFKDSVSIQVAPGWKMEKKGGGQIISGKGERGMAVMLVTPPSPISGCPKLCVLGVHPGHEAITGGNNIVKAACGSVAKKCAIAMGDWNNHGSAVKSSFPSLIGGTVTALAPDEDTCCHPKGGSPGNHFDHAVTNIQGASADAKVWEYQVLPKMDEQHKPICVNFNFR